MNEIPETKFKQIIETLLRGGVDFILIGGLAAAAHGSAQAYGLPLEWHSRQN